MSSKIPFDIVVACDAEGGIARNGEIPWHNTQWGKDDLREFRKLTIDNVVIMGRKTYDSIGRPLPFRVNMIITSGVDRVSTYNVLSTAPIIHCPSFDSALEYAQEHYADKRRFCIGGAMLYKLALNMNYEKIHMNINPAVYNCDLFMPSNPEEQKYLNLIRRCKEEGILRPNRTGIPTYGLFSEVLKFDLRDGVLPLLTTKRVPFITVIHELLWFLSGECTTIDYLKKNKVKIWDGNSTREFLDSRGLIDYPEGTVGPIYGYQWRHWGGDQLGKLIERARADPYDRRLICSAWNVDDLDKMALPPCHLLFQLVCCDTYVNIQVYMRSADIALGVPFNIASYSILLYIIAHLIGKRAGTVSIMMADCHLYSNHVEGTDIQRSRWPMPFPKFRLSEKLLGFTTLDEFANSSVPSDYIIEDYHFHPTIPMAMAV